MNGTDKSAGTGANKESLHRTPSGETDKGTDAKTYYADIFSLPHWEPALCSGKRTHPRMPMEKRAAIFASFDCLSGYKDTIAKTTRDTNHA